MTVEQAQGQPHVQRYPVIQQLIVGGEVRVGKIQIGEHHFVGNEGLVVQGKGLINHRRLIAANARMLYSGVRDYWQKVLESQVKIVVVAVIQAELFRIDAWLTHTPAIVTLPIAGVWVSQASMRNNSAW